MNEKDRITEDRPEPWEQNFYETGCTRPPKNQGGCILVLMVIIIVLGGIITVMGMLGFRMFHFVSTEPTQDASVGFSNEESTDATEFSETTLPKATDEISLELSDTPQAVANVPQEGGLSLQDIYEKAIDSVVSISCNTGTGTGVVISRDGYIATNCHVIEGASTIQVLLTDGRTLDASLVGADTTSDLAVLRVRAEDLTPAEFGDSDAIRVGDAVVAIGDPLGIELRGTMTNGIISAINRDITTGGRTMTLIQTNAALNSGNSGGPLLNCYGQVIGINTMKIGDYMNANGVEGLGFAIPSKTVKEVIDQLVNQGYVSGRPRLGIEGQAISTIDRLYYRLPQGLYITEVEQSSDAAAKGIIAGDILLQLDDTRIYDPDTLQSALYAYNAGDAVSLTIYRNGSQYTVEVTLSEAK